MKKVTYIDFLKLIGGLAFCSPIFSLGLPLVLIPFSNSWVYTYVSDISIAVLAFSFLVMSIHSLYLSFLILQRGMYIFLIKFVLFHLVFNVFSVYICYYRVVVEHEELDESIFRLPF